jgi:prophage regulatory protein
MSADGQPQTKTQQPTITFLRLPDVEQRVKLKRSAIYQRMSEGRFPKSRSLGTRCTVWIESEIEAWMTSLAAPHD